MAIFGLSMSAKDAFVDRPAIKGFLAATGLKALPKIGAYIRRRARGSMKRKGMARRPPKKKGGKAEQRRWQEIKERPASLAPSPPNVHSPNEDTSLKKILFAVDVPNERVIVGPVLLNSSKKLSLTVPQLMEYGGTVLLTGRRGARMATYPARPYMGPALAAEIAAGTLAPLFAPGRAA